MINKSAEDFKKNNCSDKIKRIKTISQKHFAKLQKMRNTQSKIKPIKIKQQPETTYCFGCKDYTQNFRPKEVNMKNKTLREKSHSVICRLNQSRFLKQKINNQCYKNKMNTYCVKCKKDSENIDPKMFRTKKNRLVMQSKYPVCGIKKSVFV